MVSIVVPVYNAEKTLERCIDSLLKQTYKNIEIILVNDGSTDNSMIKCEEIAKRDSRIKIINKTNGGASSARNAGIEFASGKYIMFIDSDDTVEPRWCESLRSKFETEEIDLGICNYYCLLENTGETFNENDIKYKEILLSKYDLWNMYDLNMLNQPVTKMYKISILNSFNIRFNTNLPIGEDLMFNIEYLSKARKVYMTSERLYCYYYGRTESLSNSFYDNYYKIHKFIYMQLSEIYKETITFDAEWKNQFYLHFYHMSIFSIFYVFRNKKMKIKDKIKWIDSILQDTDFIKCVEEIDVPNKKIEKLICYRKPYLFLLYHYEIKAKEIFYKTFTFRRNKK